MRKFAIVNKAFIMTSLALVAAVLLIILCAPFAAAEQDNKVSVSINSFRKTKVEDKSVGDKIYLDTPMIPDGYTFAGWSDGKQIYPSQTEIEITSEHIEDGLNLKAVYEPIKRDNTLYIIIGASIGGLILIIIILTAIIIRRRKNALKQDAEERS